MRETEGQRTLMASFDGKAPLDFEPGCWAHQAGRDCREINMLQFIRPLGLDDGTRNNHRFQGLGKDRILQWSAPGAARPDDASRRS